MVLRRNIGGGITMKARIPTPLEQQEAQRAKGKALIKTLHASGKSYDEIAKMLCVPAERADKFFSQIGIDTSK